MPKTAAIIMVKIVETDEKATLNTQLEEDIGGAVIPLNKFKVQPEDVGEFLKVFQATTKVMKQQPGFISLLSYIEVLQAVLFSLTTQSLSL